MRIFILLSFFTLAVITGRGQALSVSGPQRGCRGQTIQLQIQTGFDANTSQAFSVQVSTNRQQWQTIGSQFVAASTLQATLPANLSGGATAYLRIVSASPSVVSNEISVLINDAPTAQLIGATLDLSFNRISTDSLDVNRLSVLNLRVTTTGEGSYQITLNDSSVHTLYERTADISRVIDRSFSYQVARVRNECGVGQVTGRPFRTNVRPVSLFIPYFGTPYACAGSPFSLKVVANQPLPATSSWYAVLTPTDGTTGAPLRASASVTPEGLVTIVSPLTTPSGKYHVSLRTNVPGMQVDIPRNDYVQITWSNQLTISNPRQTIAYGTSASLGVVYAPPYQRITYDDGFTNEVDLAGRNNYQRVVTPIQNTVYTIRSAESVYCGRAALAGPVSYTVTVVPGLVIDSLSSYEACAGTMIVGYYHANITASPGTTFPVQLNTGTTATAVILDKNRFQLPVPATLKAGTYTLAAVWNGVTGRATAQPLLVKSTPSVLLSVTEGNVNDRPGVYTLLLVSDTPSRRLDVDLSDGSRVRTLTGIDQRALAHVYADKSTNTFQLVATRNECGAGTTSNAVTLTIRRPQETSLALQLPVVYNNSVVPDYCPGDSVPMIIRTTNLPDSPVYQIEYTTQEFNWTGQYLTGRLRAGVATVRLPAQGGSYWLRVRSTESGQVSFPVRLFVASRTTARLAAVSDTYVNQLVTLSISFADSRPPFQYRLSNGLTGTTDQLNLTLQLPATPSAVYQLTSVSSGCNVPANIGADTVRVVPAKAVKPEILSAGEFGTQMQRTIPCEGGIVRVPYLTKGTFPPTARLEARLYQNNRYVQRLTVLDPTSPATIRIDSVRSVAGGESYSIRLFMMQDTSVLSFMAQDEYFTSIYRPGIARLTGGVNGQLVIDSLMNSVNGMLTLTGSGATTVWLSTGQVLTSATNQSTYPVGFSRAGTYAITQAVNVCGLVPTDGQVTVRYKPAIKSFAVAGLLCRDKPTQLTYQTVGDFPTDNEFTVVFKVFPGGTTYTLVRTRQVQGPVSITWPEDLKAGTFGTLILRSSNPAMSYESASVSVYQTPTARLIPSTTTIYPGQAVYLPIMFTEGSTNSDLRFENGPVRQDHFEKVVAVYPSQTTTYQLAAVSNGCGTGSVGGTITVQVVPRPNPSVGVGYTGDFNTLCAGRETTVGFNPAGTFGSDNVFSLQLSDSTGQNYRTIVTNAVGARPEFRFTLPANTSPGRAYRLRVSASNPAVVGSSSSYPMAVSPPVTGEIISTRQQVNKGDLATVTLKFTGLPPFRYTLASAYYHVVDGIGATDYIHTLRPRVDTSQQYCLLQVNTPTCGNGTILPGKATMIVDVLGQPYDVSVLEAVAFPNPTTDKIQISVLACEADKLTLVLTSITGEVLFQQETHIHNGTTETIPMIAYAPGLYLLKATAGDRQRTFRILRR